MALPSVEKPVRVQDAPPSRRGTRGIALPAHKNESTARPLEPAPLPAEVILPLEGGPRQVALGYIRREAMSGKELLAGESRLKVSEVPFPL